MPGNGSNTAKYRFGDFELNSVERILSQNGRRISLTPRAFDLLLVLVRADGHLMTKEALLDEVWADAVVEEGNINRTISSIRKALGETRGSPRFIETVPKAGYRFIAPVEPVLPTEAVPALPSRPALTGDEPAPRPPRTWIFALGAFVLLFGTLAAVILLTGSPPATPVRSLEPGMIRLTDNRFDEDQPHWTADNKIRFVRFVTQTRAESWVMNADGSDQRRANDQIKDLLTGGWSPDGTQVVFIKEGQGPRNVYLANSDGSNERKLPLDYPPNDWSPDGKFFAYSSAVTPENHDVFIFDIASGKSTNLTNSPAFDADPLFSPDGTQITFVSGRDGNKEAYLIDVDGTDLRRLTTDPSTDAFPVMSPDGTHIVFDSNRAGENVDVFLQDTAGRRPPLKLTDLPSNEEHRGHCWSPDGTKLVITSDAGGRSNIYVIDTEPDKPTLLLSDRLADIQFPSFAGDGKIVYQAKYDDKSMAIRIADAASAPSRKLVQTEPNTAYFNMVPTFSPDSKRVVFTNKVDGNTEIFAINSDGTGLVNLTNHPAADAAPRFSADGRTVYFQSNREGAFDRVHLIAANADGTGQRRVTAQRGYEFSPIPAGDLLVFSGDREDGVSRALDIRALRITDPQQEYVIASRRFHDTQPAVSPDGSLVAFAATSDGNSEIYIVGIDGTGPTRLTRNSAEDMSPTFSPDGRSVVFSSDRGGRFALYAIRLDG